MTSKRVIRGYLIISSLYTLSASLIWGVNTLFLLDTGLDIFGVFIANAAFTGSMALFEVPTGVLADTRGRRTSFLLSLVVVCIGTLGYVGTAVIGGGLVLFVSMSVVLGLGYTFYSGAVEAWLVDALKATDFEGELDTVFARGAIASGAAMLIGTIAGGVLGSLDLSIPFVVRAFLLAVVFGAAFIYMRDIGFTPRAFTFSALSSEMYTIARSSLQYGWQQRPVRLLILASAIQAIFMAWGFHSWQPYFLDLLGNSEAISVAGLIAALVALASMIGNAIVEWFTRFCGKRTTLMLWAAGIQTAAAVGVGLTDSFYLAVGCYMVVMAAMGAYTPVRQAYMHQLIPSDQRATVISFDSLVTNAASMGGQAGLGYLSRMRSIGVGYIVGGLSTIMVLPVVGLLRASNQRADQIRGKATQQGKQLCEGLPEVSFVDTTRR